jgi:hypothetical protein
VIPAQRQPGEQPQQAKRESGNHDVSGAQSAMLR